MSVERTLFTYCLSQSRAPDSAVALHEGKIYTWRDFQQVVSAWAGLLRRQTGHRFALHTETAYPFAIGLFALLYAGKEVWIPGNNCSGMAQQLKAESCRLLGEWPGQTESVFLGEGYWDGQAQLQTVDFELPPLDDTQARIVLYTSGSIGEPKPVVKNLRQLITEVNVLESTWGERLAESSILSTVSHQHIYGLLFRVLWPLVAGRCFHSAICLNPEILASESANIDACWVASPAHLKRLYADSPWHALSKLSAIFSSGGVLPSDAAVSIKTESGMDVVEIYGSTETGGIAWREGRSGWSLFPGMTLRPENHRWRLFSPYLTGDDGFLLEDNLDLVNDGQFLLQGRADRIIKIEEKRLSLPEMEQRLLLLESITEAAVLVLSHRRDVVAAVIVLSPEGVELLNQAGRAKTVKRLREGLSAWFDRIVLPRKWLFVDCLPTNKLGKINLGLLRNLLDSDAEKLPRLQDAVFAPGKVQLNIKIPGPREMIYFPVHFTGFPILPGVIQLAWVAHYGAILFGINDADWAFSHLEVVKFIKIVQPGALLSLMLNWKADTGELGFSYTSSTAVHSSGRMVYRQREQTVSA